MTGRRTRLIVISVACMAAIATGCSKSSNGNATGASGSSGATGSLGATGSSGTTGGSGASGSTPSASSPEPAGGAASALAGTWTGTWQNVTPAPASGTFVIKWTATGSNALTGTIDVSGAGCVGNGKIAAALQGGKISFGVVQGQASVNYTGSVSGDTMSGTYAASATCANAKGTWKASKTG